MRATEGDKRCSDAGGARRKRMKERKTCARCGMQTHTPSVNYRVLYFLSYRGMAPCAALLCCERGQPGRNASRASWYGAASLARGWVVRDRVGMRMVRAACACHPALMVRH
jgi:hypothetical protein